MPARDERRAALDLATSVGRFDERRFTAALKAESTIIFPDMMAVTNDRAQRDGEEEPDMERKPGSHNVCDAPK